MANRTALSADVRNRNEKRRLSRIKETVDYDILPRCEAEVMTTRKRLRFDVICHLSEVAGIWVLISALWRSGRQADALELAQAQFNEEADSPDYPDKAVLRDVNHALNRYCLESEREAVVNFLESGDCEKTYEIAWRLLARASAVNHPDFRGMEEAIFGAGIEPRKAEWAIVYPEERVEVLTKSAAKKRAVSDKHQRIVEYWSRMAEVEVNEELTPEENLANFARMMGTRPIVAELRLVIDRVANERGAGSTRGSAPQQATSPVPSSPPTVVVVEEGALEAPKKRTSRKGGKGRPALVGLGELKKLVVKK